MSIPLYDRASEAARYVLAKAQGRLPRAAVVLGSGLGGGAGAINDPIELPYTEIPYFVTSTVQGHAGKLIIRSCDGVAVALMEGSVHFCGGSSSAGVTLPVLIVS